MGLLDRIFGSKKDVVPAKSVPHNENCRKLMEFASRVEKLLKENRYLAKSDYKKHLEEYQKTMDFFGVLLESGMLPNFCDVNGVSEKDVMQAIDYYNRIESYVEAHAEAAELWLFRISYLR